MPPKNSYRAFLKQEFNTLIEALDLSDLQKSFLKSRWLDQVLWMEGRADSARNWYYRLRLVTIVGGAIVTAFAGINLVEQNYGIIKWIILCLSLLVTISTGIEEFFHFGERWRHYRRTVELLKMQGWQFFQLSGSYSSYNRHVEAWRTFSTQVESLILQDVEKYISMMQELEKQKQLMPEQERQNQ